MVRERSLGCQAERSRFGGREGEWTTWTDGVSKRSDSSHCWTDTEPENDADKLA